MEDDQATDVEEATGLAAEKAVRLAKLEPCATPARPYPYRFDRNRTLAELRAALGDLDPGTETEARVARRRPAHAHPPPGQADLRHLRDRTAEVQLFVSRAELGDERHARLRRASTSATGSASRARS